jgi:hypothetical protein
MRLSMLVGILAVAGLAAVALWSSASAQDPGTRTLTFEELEKGSTFTHVRNTKTRSEQANMQGDVIAFTNPLADAAGKRVGKLSGSCVTTTGSRNFMKSTLTCLGVLSLRDGTLTIQLDTRPRAAETTGAVTGGTGAYANARGVFVATATKTGATDTVTWRP